MWMFFGILRLFDLCHPALSMKIMFMKSLYCCDADDRNTFIMSVLTFVAITEQSSPDEGHTVEYT